METNTPNMKTNQPVWKLIANIGDVNPLELGRLVFVDTTGHYSPELAIFDETTEGKYELRRIVCDRCTMLAVDPATISGNHYHADKPAWFADKLSACADTYGRTSKDMARALCGSNPVERAQAYADLAGYFGGDNFDAYPVTLSAAELRRKFRSAFRG